MLQTITLGRIKIILLPLYVRRTLYYSYNTLIKRNTSYCLILSYIAVHSGLLTAVDCRPGWTLRVNVFGRSHPDKARNGENFILV